MKKILFTFLILTGIASAQVTFPSGFNIASPEPVDTRISVVNITARDAISNLYEGLQVYVQSDSTIYYYYNSIWHDAFGNVADSLSQQRTEIENNLTRFVADSTLNADSLTSHNGRINSLTTRLVSDSTADKIAINALDAEVVKKTGNQNIAGVKSFTDSVHMVKLAVDSLTIIATDTLFTLSDGSVTAKKLLLAYDAYSANQTLTIDNHFVGVTNGAVNDTITLPITAITDGQTFRVKKADNGAGATVMIVESAGTIDGQSSYTIFYQYTSYSFVKNGANYLVY